MAIHKRAGKPTRKQRFQAALKLAGMTQRQWAERREITEQHLIYVVAGTRESATLIADIDAFITEQLTAAVAA